jgi:hypothetical protein
MFTLFYWLCFMKKERIEPDYFFFDEETGEIHNI